VGDGIFVLHPTGVFVQKNIATLFSGDLHRVVGAVIIDDQNTAERFKVFDGYPDSINLIKREYNKRNIVVP
jgi:hypothetical protein